VNGAGLAGLDQGFGQLSAAPLLRGSVNHLQAVLSFVSLWRSEGEECQCHRRAEGKGAADDNEKHDMYNSISDAATECPDLRFVWVILPKYIAVKLLRTNGLRLEDVPADQSVNPDPVGTLPLSYSFKSSRRIRMEACGFPRFDLTFSPHRTHPIRPGLRTTLESTDRSFA